jgi:hypothetical protein
MPDPKRRLRGLPDLGRAIDERLGGGRGVLDLRHHTGTPSAAPMRSAMGGGGDPPAFPETFITSLAAGAAGDQRYGDVELRASGTLALADSAGTVPPDRVFTLTATSMLPVAALPATGDPDLLYRLTTDDTLWRDIGGAGGWELLQASAYWLRDAATGRLTPVTGGDDVLLPGGSMLLKRAAASASENMLAGYDDGAVIGTDYPKFRAYHDGILLWGAGGGSADDCALGRVGAGVLGSGTTTVWRVQFCQELSEQAVAPAAGAAGEVRLYALEDGRLYGRSSGGTQHDLTVAQRQAFPASDGGGLALPTANAPFGHALALLPGDYATAAQQTLTLPGPTSPAAGVLAASFARASWTSDALGGLVKHGAQVAIGAACQRVGGAASARCRVRVNDPARLSTVYLSLNDDAGTPHAASVEFLGALAANTWYEAQLPEVEVSAWTGALRVVVTAQGTATAANVGATSVDVEWLEVTQWM